MKLQTRGRISPLTARPIAEAPRLRKHEREARRRGSEARLERPARRPFRQKRIVVQLPRRPRPVWRFVPVPRAGSRIDPTPRTYDRWGWLRTGTRRRRLLVDAPPESQPTMGPGVLFPAALAFLAALAIR